MVIMARDGNNGAPMARDGARNFPKGVRMFNKSAQARMAPLARDVAKNQKLINQVAWPNHKKSKIFEDMRRSTTWMFPKTQIGHSKIKN